MNTARRSYLSLPPALESIRIYREKLRDYSPDELEDVYFHIDVLREPLRYRLVQMEMDRRGLMPGRLPELAPLPVGWIERAPGFTGMSGLRSLYLSLLIFFTTLVAMAVTLGPIWFLAVPLHIRGVQASLVYLVLVPATILFGLAFGIKAGGLRMRSLASVAAVGVSVWLFIAAGGMDAILQPLYRAGGGSGSLFNGW